MTIRHLLLLIALLLIGCSGLPSETTVPSEQLGGGSRPDLVTGSFFTTLAKALRDPNLGNETRRSAYVEELASYFAPDERDAQRVMIDQALQGFADDRAKLADDETLTIDITFGTPKILSEDATRALVVLPNASIFMQISKLTDRGPVPYYEQPISLDRVIGRADGAVPTIKIGNRWFLTEG
jgi:hypothetical protein